MDKNIYRNKKRIILKGIFSLYTNQANFNEQFRNSYNYSNEIEDIYYLNCAIYHF
ncbi:hypothetical protein BH10BAC2_BH10BAC2_14960 [soil metagenome]